MSAPSFCNSLRLVLLCLAVPAVAFGAGPRPALEIESPDQPPELVDQVPVGTAAGDTLWIADWSFDGAGGCTDAGWTRLDNRILNDGSNYWVVDSRFDGTGGILGHSAVLTKHDLFWPYHDGYGNDWDYSLVLAYRGAGATLSFAYLCDTDATYDFVTVEADSAGASEARVNYAVAPSKMPAAYRTVLFTATGLQTNGVVSALALPDFGVPETTHEAYIRFASDHSYSAEDGLVAPVLGAALAVDEIAVTGDLAYTEDFEGTLDPHVTLANTAPATPFGEWARLYPHVSDNDPCTENSTCAWLFSDPARMALSPAMAFGPGGSVVRNWLDDVIVSPWVGVPPGAGSTVLAFRRFGGNTFSKSSIVMNWSVRSQVRVDNTDTPAPGDSVDGVTPWDHATSWNNLSSFTWTTVTNDVTSYVDPGARALQVRFRVSDYQYYAGVAGPATLDPGPGPYLDRIRVGRSIPTGPRVEDYFQGETLAQDMFPGVLQEVGCGARTYAYYVPTQDRFGTCDFSGALEMGWGVNLPPWVQCSARCDSINFRVYDARGVGLSGVYLYGAIVAGPHAGKAPPPWSVDASGFFRADASRGTFLCGQQVANMYDADLDDEYFRGGDVLYYFLAAADNAGGFTSYPPGLAAPPVSVAQAEAATSGLLEVSFLPTIDWDPAYLARIAAHASGKLDPTPQEIANSHQRSCILYVNQAVDVPRSDLGHRTALLRTLDRLGYRGLCDVYDQNNRGSSTVNNQLAGRATIQQATGYALIVQDADRYASNTTLPVGGAGAGIYPQTGWYRNWLAQAPVSEAGRATLWLVGNDIVANVSAGNPLVFGDMGVTLAATSQPSGVHPNVLGQGSFTWADSTTTDFSGDALFLTGLYCPPTYPYDGLGASGSAVVTHRYFQGATPGTGAVVARANAASKWNTLLMSFAWGDIRDPQGTPPGAQEDVLARHILDAVLPAGCRALADPVTDVDPGRRALPFATRLHQNAPNPFNPVTTIVFDLAAAGRVRMQVYDVAGRRVRTLVDEWRGAGWNQRVAWNGLDESGHQVANGIYLYQLSAGDFRSTMKMIVLK